MAEKVTVSVPHSQGRDTVRESIERNFHKVHEKLGGRATVEHAWAGDVMQFKASALGAKVTGDVTVNDDHVLVEVELPWMLKGLSGKVQETIAKEGPKLLAKK